MEQEGADGVKRKEQDSNTDAVRPTHAPERFMENTTSRSSARVTSATRKPHAQGCSFVLGCVGFSPHNLGQSPHNLSENVCQIRGEIGNSRILMVL